MLSESATWPGLENTGPGVPWGTADGVEMVKAGEGKCGFMLGIVGNGGSCSHSWRPSGVTIPESSAYWQ